MFCALLISVATAASPALGLKRLVPDPCHPGRFAYAVDRVETQAVPIVSASQIENLKAPDVSEILARTNYPASPIRTSPTLVLIDGRRTTETFKDIQDIEVLKGPQGTLYGSDAVASVLNVLTKREEQFPTTDTWYNPNENLRNDAWKRIRVNYEYKDLLADTSVYNVTTLEGHEPQRTLLGHANVYLATYLVPRVEEEFVQDLGQFGGMDSNYWNLTGGIKFTDEYAQKLGTPAIWLPRPKFDPKIGMDWTKQPLSNPGQYLQDSIRSFGQDRVQDWISRTGLPMNSIQNFMQGAAGSGTDMNNLNFPGDPQALSDAKCGSSMSMGPGTLWYPDKAGYQGISNITPFDYSFGAPGSPIVPGKMRTHCINMALKEPAAGVRYYPYSSPDLVWNRLATMSGQAMIRGPWDQARTWIYTDKASMDEINKRVMLGVTPSQYTNGLFDVASLGGLRYQDFKNKDIFSPQLFGSYTAKDPAFNWLSTNIGINYGKEVGAYLNSKPNEILQMFSPNAKPEEQAHATRLFGNLLSSPNPDARKGAMSFLKAQNVNLDHISQRANLIWSLYSKDPGEVGLALDMCEKIQNARPVEALRFVANNGPSQALKDRAAALIGKSD